MDGSKIKLSKPVYNCLMRRMARVKKLWNDGKGISGKSLLTVYMMGADQWNIVRWAQFICTGGGKTGCYEMVNIGPTDLAHGQLALIRKKLKFVGLARVGIFAYADEEANERDSGSSVIEDVNEMANGAVVISITDKDMWMSDLNEQYPIKIAGGK